MVTAFIIVSWFFGILGIVGVSRQPYTAFANAGHSKRFWLAIEIAGTVLSFFGIFTWIAFRFFVKPSVVRAGGRQKAGYWRLFRREAGQAIRKGNTEYMNNRARPRQLGRPSSLGLGAGSGYDSAGYYSTIYGTKYWDGSKWTT